MTTSTSPYNFYDQPSSSFWELYHRYRPVYPNELFEFIFDYHNKHSKGTSIAIDYGSGPGTVIPQLLTQFEKVIGVDLNTGQIEQGRKLLQEKYGQDRVEMHVSAAEDCKFLPKADLIVAAEAVHWFDAERWIAEAGRLLTKGGTLAFWQYPAYCVVLSDNNEEANKCLTMLYHSVFNDFMEKAGPPLKYALACVAFQLDNIEIDSTLFENEERHKWNHDYERNELTGPGVTCKMIAGDSIAQVGKDAKMKDYPMTKSGTFLQRRNWKIEDLLCYFESLSFVPREKIYDDEKVKVARANFERAIGGKDKSFDVGWWLSLVLATRR